MINGLGLPDDGPDPFFKRTKYIGTKDDLSHGREEHGKNYGPGISEADAITALLV